MKLLRRLSYLALAVAFAQIVFGAIVRISGSGWGCGEHWPKCDGHWVPPFAGAELIVEVSHRYGALLTTACIVALLVLAWRRRAGAETRDGVFRGAVTAAVIVVATALFGMITIKLRLDPRVIVGHFLLAMSLLATLVVVAVRAGGFGAAGFLPVSPDATALAAAARSWRVARIAVVLALAVLVLGAFTANYGAGAACLGFPGCRVYRSDNGGLVALQLTHRVLAILFALHVLGAAMMIRRRPVAPVVKRAVWIALATVVLQILVAAALVETRLPPVLRSLHQAVGTLVWIAVVAWAALAWRAASAEPALLDEPVRRDQPDGGSARRRDLSPAGAGAGLAPATPPFVPVVPADPDVNSRLGEIERAAKAYESAMAALVAEAEAAAAEPEEPTLAADAPPGAEPTSAEPSDPKPPSAELAGAELASAELAGAELASAELPSAELASAELPSAVEAPTVEPVPLAEPEPFTEPEPLTEPAPERAAEPSPCNAPPVEIPDGVVTPAQPTPALPPKKPHSVAVIVARGADF